MEETGTHHYVLLIYLKQQQQKPNTNNRTTIIKYLPGITLSRCGFFLLAQESIIL